MRVLKLPVATALALSVIDGSCRNAAIAQGHDPKDARLDGKAVRDGDYHPLNFIWWPTPSSVRKAERVKALARNVGLVEYWRAKGWPEFCRPVGADDFVCD